MCKRCQKSVDHLLFHCPIVYKLWKMEFHLFGLQWVTSKRVIDLFAAWQGSFWRHRNIAFWKAVPHCIGWSFWQEWNAKVLRVVNGLSLMCCFSSFSLYYLLDLVEHCNLRAVCNSPWLHPQCTYFCFINKFFHYSSKKKC